MQQSNEVSVSSTRQDGEPLCCKRGRGGIWPCTADVITASMISQELQRLALGETREVDEIISVFTELNAHALMCCVLVCT